MKIIFVGLLYHLLFIKHISFPLLIYSFILFLQSFLDIKTGYVSDILTVLIWIMALNYVKDLTFLSVVIITFVLSIIITLALNNKIGWGDLKILPTFLIIHKLESFILLTISSIIYLIISLKKFNYKKKVPFIPIIFLAQQLSLIT